jgi:hypothetical protein
MIKLSLFMMLIVMELFGACSNDLDIGSHKIINLSTPTSSTDAANKAYVDDKSSDNIQYIDKAVKFIDGINPNAAVYTSGNVGIGTNNPKVKLHVESTDAIVVPVGTTSQRPTGPVVGMIRFNSDLNLMEGYDGKDWISFE